MTTTADRAKALAYFVGAGWTPEQAAGIVANLVAESNLNPAAVGDGEHAYGIAQWHGDRQQGFQALMGKPIQGSSLDDQLLWVNAELQRGEHVAGTALHACTTAAEAGATVSKLYERPADAEGEAARRGALAEAILEQFQAPQATPAPEPVPEPPPTAATPQGAPMGLVATLLPIIMQLVPALNGIKGLQGVVGALSGAVPPVALGQAPSGGSLHAGDYIALAKTILDTFVGAVPAANGNPLLAVGMAQNDPAVLAPAAQAVTTHPDVVAALNAQIPVFDKIAEYDKQTNAAAIAGRQAAAAVAASDKYDVAPIMVGNLVTTNWVILASLGGAVLLSIVGKAIFPDLPDYTTAIFPVITFIIGQHYKERGAVFAYRFDGTPAANAAATANQQIVAMNAIK